MNPFKPIAQNQKKTPYTNDNFIESFRGIGSSVGKTVSQDIISKGTQSAIDSLFGAPPRNSNSQELRPNETVMPENRTSGFANSEYGNRSRVLQPETGLENKIEDVRKELAQLAASLSSLNKEVEKAISESPVEPGIYHLNYFERLKSFLILLRKQVNESREWLAMWSGRSKRKKGYWGMYKKHGTTFGLSHERTTATASG